MAEGGNVVQGSRAGAARNVESGQKSTGEEALHVIAEIVGTAVDVNLDETNDEVAIFGGVNGSETADAATRQIVNVDSAGNVRTDLNKIGGTAISADGGRQQVNATMQVADADVSASNPVPSQVAGDVAHDAADSGNPVKVGGRAIAHGANPTAVSADERTNWYFNRAGVPFFIGGHPNVQSVEYNWTTAPSSDDIVSASAGTKVVVTQLLVALDEAATVGVSVRIGFGDTLPTAPADQATATGILLSHPGLVPGGGISRGDGSGILGVGADGEDLSITAEAPTGGSGKVIVSYYTVPS